MPKSELNKQEVKIRNKIYVEAWLAFKGEITMKQLAAIFNIPANNLYQILRRESGKYEIRT